VKTILILPEVVEKARKRTRAGLSSMMVAVVLSPHLAASFGSRDDDRKGRGGGFPSVFTCTSSSQRKSSKIPRAFLGSRRCPD